MPEEQHADLERIAAEKARWEREKLDSGPLRHAETQSGIALDALYTPDVAPDDDYLAALGFPGEYPFTRGIYPSMYRGRRWTIRQYSGLATAEDTNARYKFLLERGQTGLSVALDLPTQMGYDSDHPLATSEVGKVGVAIDTVADMAALFDGIPLDEVSVHFTINATAAIIFAMYLAVAEQRGIAADKLRGTLQNDILKEFLSRNTYIFPPQPSMRLVGDVIAYSYQHVPQFYPISVTGYHVREAGANAIQEVAFALAAAIAYVTEMVGRGIGVDEFAPRLSFHFSSQQRDLFEEICKIRAARRIWARIMCERFDAQDPRSQMMRFFCGSSGVSLSRREPLNNIVRGTLQCLAGVLAGAQACHVPSYDEAYSVPSEEAALISVRTQQILAYESGVADVVDPLGGSYFIEALTDRLEAEIVTLLDKIDASGGIVRAIEQGEPQLAILEGAQEIQRKVERGERITVAENAFVGSEADTSGRTVVGPGAGGVPGADEAQVQQQVDQLEDIKAQRDQKQVEQALNKLRATAEGASGKRRNLMVPILEAVRVSCTVGEITDVLRDVFGEYRPPSVV